MAVPTTAAVLDHPSRRASSPSRERAPLAWRTALLVAVACAVALAFAVGDPSTRLRADPELARLLRGMAMIKCLLVAAAVAAIWWRFARPVAVPVATGYVVAAALIAGATMAIWQLSFIVAAAGVFHLAALMAMLLAWRDDGVRDRLLARRPASSSR